MKRPAGSTSDSLGALISICHTSDQEQSPRINGVYATEFESMLDGFDEEECGNVAEKKRRLGAEQVKALEKNFEVENKLDPDRKVKLARELGLQPRQVAVWFQNRRARWKTKQLERDYGALKSNYDNLKLNYQNLQQGNQALLQEIRELKTKVEQDKSNFSVEEERVAPVEKFSVPAATAGEASLKDGSSDSDSSAILNEDYSPTAVGISSPAVVQNHHMTAAMNYGKGFQFPKMEEHNFFSGEEEACNFFSDEQPPTLHWWS